MKSIFVLFIALLFLNACSDDSVIHVVGDVPPGLVIDATIDKATKHFQPGEVKIRGYLVIGNTSDEPLAYSNSRLRLSIDQFMSERTYVDSFASHVVDVGNIDIAPGQTIEFHAYWVMPDDVGTSWFDGEVSLSLAGR